MWKWTQKANLLSLVSNLLYVVCPSLRKCLNRTSERTENRQNSWTRNEVMDTGLSKIIAVCWPVLPSFIYRMLNFQLSEVQVCTLGSLRPDAPGCSCNPLLQSSSRESWQWVHRGVCSPSWSCVSCSLCSCFLVVPLLPAQASHVPAG